MPNYKRRMIELTPRRQADGTWHCPYRIIECRQTSWAYHKGCLDGRFASREEAAAAALQEAKYFVDLLEASTQVPRSESGLHGEAHRNRMSRLTFSFGQSVVHFGNRVLRSMFLLPMYRTILNTVKVFAWSRR